MPLMFTVAGGNQAKFALPGAHAARARRERFNFVQSAGRHVDEPSSACRVAAGVWIAHALSALVMPLSSLSRDLSRAGSFREAA